MEHWTQGRACCGRLAARLPLLLRLRYPLPMCPGPQAAAALEELPLLSKLTIPSVPSEVLTLFSPAIVEGKRAAALRCASRVGQG